MCIRFNPLTDYEIVVSAADVKPPGAGWEKIVTSIGHHEWHRLKEGVVRI